jgi:hypothetical protein
VVKSYDGNWRSIMDWRTENAVTVICTVVLVLGLYGMSGSWHSFWGALLLLNVNYPKG